MNTGVVARRYAKALLMLTQQSGRGEQVFDQIRVLLRDPASAGVLEPDLQSLLELLAANGREDYLKFVFSSYISLYCESAGVRIARLVSAFPSEDLGRRLCELVSKDTGLRIVLESSVDPELIGGFVFDIDGWSLDASIKRRIEAVRRQFIEKNTRLV